MDPRFSLSTYSYELGDDRIAQTAAHPPESARMLTFDRASGTLEDRVFSELPEIAGSGRTFFFNDSRVIASRVSFESAVFTNREGLQREKAGEVFFIREIGGSEDIREIGSEGVTESVARNRFPRFEALVFPGAAFSPGSTVRIGEFVLAVMEKIPDGRILEIRS
jgi:hypothetical protein